MTRGSLLVARLLGCALTALAVTAPATAAERLGRLFFSPEQRTTLDAARSKKTRVVLETETETEAARPPAPPTPEVVTYDGIVRRSDGKATVWLNNQPIQDKDVRSGATIVGRVRPDGSVTLRSAQSERPVDLKVGQRAEMLSGAVEEGYARGGLVPARPEPEKPEARADARPPAASNAAGAESAEREAAARHRARDTEDALRAIQDAATRSATPPPPPPQPQPLQRFPK